MGIDQSLLCEIVNLIAGINRIVLELGIILVKGCSAVIDQEV